MNEFLTFEAISTEADSRIVDSRERVQHGDREWVLWGKGNRYPDYLLELYNEVTTLRSIVNGSVDYAGGNAVNMTGGPQGDDLVNITGETASQLCQKLFFDMFLYRGFAMQVIRDRSGRVSELYHIDLRHLRSDSENQVFYYSEKWGRSGQGDAVVFPKYVPGFNEPNSIYFWKGTSRSVYPTPVFAASVKACEIERCIDDYHLAAIENGFAGSVMINFNNGAAPTDDQKREIKQRFRENYGGARNAGKMVFSWNPSKVNATTIDSFPVQDFGEKYRALADHSRQQLFTAFRANPNLFGIPTENLGFSQEEYESAFRLYNRTQIRPVQQAVVSAVSSVLPGASLTIEPFTLD